MIMNIKSSHECNSNTPSIKGAGLICIVDLRCQIRCVCTLFCCHSDQMGNKGAFITLTKDLKPQFTTYEAVVSHVLVLSGAWLDTCNHSHTHHIPYSGKLSREKTFMNFEVLSLFAKVFSVKFGGVV